MQKYLKAFAKVNYRLIDAQGKNGTCAGISDALEFIPDNSSFLIIWSDLILSANFELPKNGADFIALSGDFPCRWKYENGVFSEERSVTNGVAVFFGNVSR